MNLNKAICETREVFLGYKNECSKTNYNNKHRKTVFFDCNNGLVKIQLRYCKKYVLIINLSKSNSARENNMKYRKGKRYFKY